MEPGHGDHRNEERDRPTDIEIEGEKGCKYGDKRDGEIGKHCGGVDCSDGGSEGGGVCGS